MSCRGAACDVKSRHHRALYALLTRHQAAGLKPTARIHFPCVIEEGSTGLGVALHPAARLSRRWLFHSSDKRAAR